MIRKCHWCGKEYDTDKASSVFCDKNPNRGRGYARWKQSRPDKTVTIGVVLVPPSPFVNAAPNGREG